MTEHHHDEHVEVVHEDRSGFSSGVLVALLILIVVVALLLLFNAGPGFFNVNVNVRSWLEPILL